MKRDTVRRLATFVTADESRGEAMAGIYCDGTRALASDGHRLAIFPTPETSWIRIERGLELARVPHDKVDYPSVEAILKTIEGGLVAEYSFPASKLNMLAAQAVVQAEIKGETDPSAVRVVFELTGAGCTANAWKSESGGFNASATLRASDRERKVMLNARYLSDALERAQGEVTMRFVDCSPRVGPVDIRRADGERHIIMPVMW